MKTGRPLLLVVVLGLPACTRTTDESAVGNERPESERPVPSAPAVETHFSAELVPLGSGSRAPTQEALTLRMPFRAGVVVLCSQGNRSRAGTTHGLSQNAYALDFSARGEPEVEVVSAASGRVAHVVRGSAVGRQDAGGGYGNQVWLDHGAKLMTLYAHLDAVSVEVGQSVAAGARLGTMGRTGLANDRHLHFALEFTAHAADPASVNFPIEVLVARTFHRPGEFRALRGTDFEANPDLPWSGGIYGSENDGSPEPHLGSPPAAVEVLLAANSDHLRRTLELRRHLEEFDESRPASAENRAHLAKRKERAPDDPVLLYDFAVSVEIPARRWSKARELLDRAAVLAAEPRWFEIWLPAWIENQRGAIALAEGHAPAAEAHFERAAALWSSPEVIAFAETMKRR